MRQIFLIFFIQSHFSSIFTSVLERGSEKRRKAAAQNSCVADMKMKGFPSGSKSVAQVIKKLKSRSSPTCTMSSVQMPEVLTSCIFHSLRLAVSTFVS